MKKETKQYWVIGVAVFCIVLMIGADSGRLLVRLLDRPSGCVGRLNGSYLKYDDYQAYQDSMGHGRNLSLEERAQVNEVAWHNFIKDKLYACEGHRLGMMVSDGELVDLVQGNHIDSRILDGFKNPKSGKFSKQQLLDYLRNLTPEQQQWWLQVEKQLAADRIQQKIKQLMEKSCFVTPIEKRYQAAELNKTYDVDYVYIPFHHIDNAVCVVNDSQLRDYMVKHKPSYLAKDCKFIQYVTFHIEPDQEDQERFQESIKKLKDDFAHAQDAYLFARQNTDGPLDGTKLSFTPDQLPEPLKALKGQLKQGALLQVDQGRGSCCLYKIVDVTNSTGWPKYNMAACEKRIYAGEHTHNKCYRRALNFVANVKNSDDFKRLAESYHLVVKRSAMYPHTYHLISGDGDAREIVRWLYTEARVNGTSKVFTLGNDYVIVNLVGQTKQGDILPLSDVYNKVYECVANQIKADIIKERLQAIACSSLTDMASQYGEGALVGHIQGLYYGYQGDNLQGGYKLLGVCSGLEVGAISKPIVEDRGVFIVEVKAKYDREKSKHDVGPSSSDRWQMMQNYMQSIYLVRDMQEHAKIKDERYLFQ